VKRPAMLRVPAGLPEPVVLELLGDDQGDQAKAQQAKATSHAPTLGRGLELRHDLKEAARRAQDRQNREEIHGDESPLLLLVHTLLSTLPGEACLYSAMWKNMPKLSTFCHITEPFLVIHVYFKELCLSNKPKS